MFDYDKNTYANDEFDLMLPQFSATNVGDRSKDETCSSFINGTSIVEDGVPYSDNVYGHLWFPKSPTCKKVSVLPLFCVITFLVDCTIP